MNGKLYARLIQDGPTIKCIFNLVMLACGMAMKESALVLVLSLDVNVPIHRYVSPSFRSRAWSFACPSR